MTLQELIDKHELSKSALARKMGMSVGSFNNKLNPKTSMYQFNEFEKDKLKIVFRQMAKDLQEVNL